MNRIALKLADKRQWFEIFDRAEFTLFVLTDQPPKLGERVRVDLTVGPGGPRVILRGDVVARQPPRSGLRAGFKLGLGPYEREKVNYLSGYVRGGLLDLREMRRLPIRLAVTYRAAAGQRQGFTRDLNEAGLFIIDEAPLPEGTQVSLELYRPDGAAPLSLQATVSHTVVVEDEDVPGMGLRLELDANGRSLLRDVVDELEQRLIRGTLPDETLL